MAAVFLTVSVVAVEIRSGMHSKERTEQLAEIVAPVLAKGDRAELERLVTSFTDKQVAVFTSEG
ncbi:MAG: hypothetical protein AAF216_02165, partial [Pseudomonadota bacterium]